MDRLELAERRFDREIKPVLEDLQKLERPRSKPGDKHSTEDKPQRTGSSEGLTRLLEIALIQRHGVAKNVVAWMTQCVIPAVQELWDRPSFQDLAAWPMRHLGPNADTPEWQQLEQTVEALRKCARLLLKLSDVPAVQDNWQHANPGAIVAFEERWIGASSPSSPIQPRRTEPLETYRLLRNQAKLIAEISASAVVNHDDYLTPKIRALVSNDRPDSPSKGGEKAKAHKAVKYETVDSRFPMASTLHPMLNPEIVAVGDNVSRSMMARIDELIDTLRDFRIGIDRSIRSSGIVVNGQREAEAWDLLKADRDALHRICLRTTDLAARESAITLTLVHLAHFPEADRDWLGLSNASVKRASQTVREWYEHRCVTAFLERVASAIHDMRTYYESFSREELDFEKALAQADLIMVKHPPLMYWQQKELLVEWRAHAKAWEFWFALANKVRSGTGLTILDLEPHEDHGSSTFHSRKKRADELVRRHAPKLAAAIVSGDVPGSYRLNLDPSKVRVLEGRTTSK